MFVTGVQTCALPISVSLLCTQLENDIWHLQDHLLNVCFLHWIVSTMREGLFCFHSPSYHQHALPHQKQPAYMLMLTEQTQTNLLAVDTESLTGLQVSAFSSGPLRPPALAESGPNGSPGAHGSVLLGLSLAWVPKRVWTRGLGCFYTHPCTENIIVGSVITVVFITACRVTAYVLLPFVHHFNWYLYQF